MTSEMRFGEPPGGAPMPPESGMPEHGAGPAGHSSGPPARGSARPAGIAGPGSAPPPMGSHSPEPPGGQNGPDSPDLRRLDELRRGFQPRRFGSGYDRNQVDQLFEQVIAGVSGHRPLSVSDDELDPRRFDLVPGGYFEGDVDAAISEVREIVRRY